MSGQEAATWEIGTASLMVNLTTPGSLSDSNHSKATENDLFSTEKNVLETDMGDFNHQTCGGK